LYFAISYAILKKLGGVLMKLNEAIKNIRNKLSISQEQLARELNVSYTTLNRWENNRTSPSRLAKMRIAEYCSYRNLPQNIINVFKE